MSNLLVVDFDYFFKNSMEALDTDDPAFWLYDWGHQEGSALHENLWPLRAAQFLQHDFALPQVDVPDNWWNRFNIAEHATVEVSDSNMYSGVAGGDQEFEHVWLYDAHHDLYRIKTREQLRDWANEGQVTCEDWMFAHWIRGAKLHWRWPRWHKAGKSMRATIPKWVGADARRDDMGKLDSRMEFDTISICRSGSWVPPWCDEAFIKFYSSAPAEIALVDEYKDVSVPRPWSDDEVQRIIDEFRHLDALKPQEAP